MAAYNLLYFWAHNGYPKLITDQVLLYLLHPYYGSHYVVFMGYTTNYWYVVHDGWNTNDVYRNFNYDKSYISNLAYTIWGM